MASSSMAGGLAGIRAVELAGIGQAAHVCMPLGDLSADVVRAERGTRIPAIRRAGVDENPILREVDAAPSVI